MRNLDQYLVQILSNLLSVSTLFSIHSFSTKHSDIEKVYENLACSKNCFPVFSLPASVLNLDRATLRGRDILLLQRAVISFQSHEQETAQSKRNGGVQYSKLLLLQPISPLPLGLPVPTRGDSGILREEAYETKLGSQSLNPEREHSGET